MKIIAGSLLEMDLCWLKGSFTLFFKKYIVLALIVSLMFCVCLFLLSFSFFDQTIKQSQSANRCFLLIWWKRFIVASAPERPPRLESGIRGSVSRGQEREQIQNTSKFVISAALHSFITEFIGATSHKAKVHAPLSTKTQVVLHLQNHLTSLIIL